MSVSNYLQSMSLGNVILAGVIGYFVGYLVGRLHQLDINSKHKRKG